MLDRRLIIVTGKGGSGRSAVSAAFAIKAGREGMRTLAIAMTDPIGLGMHLGADLGYTPAEVRSGVSALAIDRRRALREYVRLRLHIPRGALAPVVRAFEALADTVPGIRDTITIGKVAFEVLRGTWDVVIADGPPLGQIESYLRAPATIARMVPTGKVQQEAATMERLLGDATRCGLVVTTLAEELAATEAIDGMARLEAERLCDVGLVITNRVLTPLDAVPDDLPPGPLLDAALLHSGLVAAQQEWRSRLLGVELPMLFGVLTPGEVAARLADVLP